MNNFSNKTKESFKDITALDNLEKNIAELIKNFYEEHDICDNKYYDNGVINNYEDYGYYTGLIPEIRDFIIADISDNTGVIFEPQIEGDAGFSVRQRTPIEEKNNIVWKNYLESDSPVGFQKTDLSSNGLDSEAQDMSKASKETVSDTHNDVSKGEDER